MSGRWATQDNNENAWVGVSSDGTHQDTGEAVASEFIIQEKDEGGATSTSASTRTVTSSSVRSGNTFRGLRQRVTLDAKASGVTPLYFPEILLRLQQLPH